MRGLIEAICSAENSNGYKSKFGGMNKSFIYTYESHGFGKSVIWSKILACLTVQNAVVVVSACCTPPPYILSSWLSALAHCSSSKQDGLSGIVN